jgi:hypothetical protein
MFLTNSTAISSSAPSEILDDCSTEASLSDGEGTVYLDCADTPRDLPTTRNGDDVIFSFFSLFRLRREDPGHY